MYSEDKRVIFSGDLIFENGEIGSYDKNYSNLKDFSCSIDKILKLPDDAMVFPGHGEPFRLMHFKKITHLLPTLRRI